MYHSAGGYTSSWKWNQGNKGEKVVILFQLEKKIEKLLICLLEQYTNNQKIICIKKKKQPLSRFVKILKGIK